MKNRYLALLIALLSYALPTLACGCLFTHPSEAFQHADIVFTGETLPINEDSNITVKERMLFEVEQVYKGKFEKRIELWRLSYPCGLYLTTGRKYLVYAYKSEDGRFYSTVCSRTNFLERAEVDLLFLNGLPASLNQGSVAGHIYNYFDPTMDYKNLPPFNNIKVRISNDKNSYETVTDETGFYKFLNIKPGIYRYSFDVNTKYTSGFDYNLNLEIKESEFWEVDQTLIANGILWGRLTDKYDKPLQNIGIILLPTDSIVNKLYYFLNKYSYVDYTGNFYFDRIPPGKYLLGINIEEKEVFSVLYIKLYYPGVENILDANIFEISFGDSLGNINFQLPFEKRIKYLEGKVVFQDTSLRIVGEVQLRTTNDPERSELIEKTWIQYPGHYTMMLLEGMKGWLHIKVNGIYPKSDNNPEAILPEPIFYEAEHDIDNLNINISTKNQIVPHR
jgi:hypothetical protein